MITAKGIYLDLNDSTYFYRINDYKFYFSSRFYREKFINEMNNFCKEETIRLENRLKTSISNSIFLLFVLYSKIEKRGFRIEENLKGKSPKTYTCMPQITLNII